MILNNIKETIGLKKPVSSHPNIFSLPILTIAEKLSGPETPVDALETERRARLIGISVIGAIALVGSFVGINSMHNSRTTPVKDTLKSATEVCYAKIANDGQTASELGQMAANNLPGKQSIKQAMKFIKDLNEANNNEHFQDAKSLVITPTNCEKPEGAILANGTIIIPKINK